MHKTLYFTSSLSEKEFRKEIDRALVDYPQFDKRYRLNRVHRGGEYLSFGFLYVQDSGFCNVLLGKNPDGSERVLYIEKDGESEEWGDVTIEQHSLPSLVEFENIRFSPATLPDLRDDHATNVLCCRNFPSSLAVNKVREYASFYSTVEDYPKIHVQKARNQSNILFLTFANNCLDARYALLMMKSVSVDGVNLRFSQAYKSSRPNQ